MESLEVPIPLPTHERWKHSDEVVCKVRELALTMTDPQIAETFNQDGLRTNKGNPFTFHSISWIRFKHKIPSPVLQKPKELSINQVAEKFNVSHHVVRYWIEREMIKARRIGSRIWLSLDPAKETELKDRIEGSTKIAFVRSKSQNVTVGGVL